MVLAQTLQLRGRFFVFVSGLDFADLGYVVVGMLLVAWAISAAVWKFGLLKDRYVITSERPHQHVHDNGLRHAHQHFHLDSGTWPASALATRAGNRTEGDRWTSGPQVGDTGSRGRAATTAMDVDRNVALHPDGPRIRSRP